MIHSMSLNSLYSQLGNVRRADHFRLKKRIDGLSRLPADKRNDKAVEKISTAIAASVANREKRQASQPVLNWPDLPVVASREEIKTAIRDHQVVVIAGETGSGKTTQLPKICLELGRGIEGTIGHTQPRRLAARAVASRVAEELNSPLGSTVGFKVRFAEQVSGTSLIKVLTDGMLLNEIQQDRFLNQYDTLIIDEAHERSLNIDFLLGYLKQLLPKRPDLKVIITSATIDHERFANHFGDAPVLEVSGRTFPVEMRYRPPAEGQELSRQIEDVLQEIQREERREGLPVARDVLVFLAGERDIRDVHHHLKRCELRDTEILPLYARLSQAEQHRIFASHRGRRVVLSTNVAETSLTVPGIRYVIDAGTARISRYSVHSKVQRLPVEPVSQASANQRAGRCGRVAPGICFRLYDETDFINRPEYTDPEILRTNLASVILQMTTSGLGDIRHFPFLEPPDRRLINDGYKLLEELGAVDDKRRLTNLGRTMARLPLDPRLARMLVTSSEQGSLAETLVIIAGLSVQDPRERPQDKQQAADQAHAPFNDKESDFLTLLNIWNFYEEQRQELSQNQLKKVCQKSFLSWMRMREWRDIHRQLTLICREQKLKLNRDAASYESLHKAILAGLLGQVAVKLEKKEYLATRNRKVMIFPGSKVSKTGPKWIVAAEIVETSRVFARVVAKIEPEWTEPLAGHVVKHHFFEPHWEQKRGQVMGYEKVSLYGLDIIAKRRIPYSKVDPEECRNLFIRRALVEGDYQSKAPFIARNRELLDTVENLERKTRRRDLLVEDEVLVAFYDQRLPADIVSGRHFESWWKQLSADQLRDMELTEADILQRPVDEQAGSLYPDYLEWEGVRYPLSYEFEPTSERDGVTLQAPVMALKQLPARRLEWLVPGLLREKCIALVKGLPKALRRNFVPVPDFVRAALEHMPFAQGNLGQALGRELTRMTGTRIDDQAWAEVSLEPHLLTNIEVVDASGKIIAEGRDYSALCSQLAGQPQEQPAPAPTSQPRQQTRAAGSYVLAESLVRNQAGIEVTFWPAWVEEGDQVQEQLFDTQSQALQAHRRGVQRLLLGELNEQARFLRQKCTALKEAAIYYRELGNQQQLTEDVLLA
ncbi:MAG: ATP-dependent RNA helicase HrpA, partial [Alcanivorax sp.]|nr:ATP-dependent RNA helicase HrpA [Alcanivorax sp.]